MKKKNGFTLIELLAVIIILGILMIIAIPSVTKYISDSRKNAYVDTAKEIITGARNVVNAGKLGMYDTNTTYYINSKCIKTENASKSPYGDFVKAYVVVTYDGTGYKYYWTSVDDAGQGVKNIIKQDKLDTDNIESDIDLGTINAMTGIGNRQYIVEFDENCNRVNDVPTMAVTKVDEAGGNVERLVYAQPESGVVPGSTLTNYYYDYKEIPNYTTNPFEAFTIDESDIIKTISVCVYENNRVYCFTEDQEGSNYQNNSLIFFQLYGTSSLYHDGNIVEPDDLITTGDGCVEDVHDSVYRTTACYNRAKKTIVQTSLYEGADLAIGNSSNGYSCIYSLHDDTVVGFNGAICYTAPQNIYE